MKIDEKEIYSHRGKAIRAIMNTLIPHLEQVKQMTKKEKAQRIIVTIVSLLNHIVKPLCDKGRMFIVFLFLCISSAEQASYSQFQRATRHYSLTPDIITLIDEKPKSLVFYSVNEGWNNHHFKFIINLLLNGIFIFKVQLERPNMINLFSLPFFNWFVLRTQYLVPWYQILQVALNETAVNRPYQVP